MINYTFLFVFLRQSRYVTQIGLEFVVLLPQPPEGWDYRCVPLHLADNMSF
jgi:hypothetical protein